MFFHGSKRPVRLRGGGDGQETCGLFPFLCAWHGQLPTLRRWVFGFGSRERKEMERRTGFSMKWIADTKHSSLIQNLGATPNEWPMKWACEFRLTPRSNMGNQTQRNDLRKFLELVGTQKADIKLSEKTCFHSWSRGTLTFFYCSQGYQAPKTSLTTLMTHQGHRGWEGLDGPKQAVNSLVTCCILLDFSGVFAFAKSKAMTTVFLQDSLDVLVPLALLVFALCSL